MRHVEAETLALLALGEDAADRETAAHLESCAVCADELESLRRVVEVARSTTPEDVPGDVPPHIWANVRAELEIDALPAPIPLPVRPPQPAPLPEHPDQPVPAAVGGGRVRRVRTAWLAAAAAVGLVLGGVGGAWWARSGGEATPPAPTVLAETALEPLPGWDAAGTAVVEEDAEGRRVVVVDVEGAGGGDGFREVWLIAPDLSGMVSLGTLAGDQGTFVIPDGLDLATFPVVDVSEEPFDGDSAHSGNSIVRGTLEA